MLFLNLLNMFELPKHDSGCCVLGADCVVPHFPCCWPCGWSEDVVVLVHFCVRGMDARQA